MKEDAMARSQTLAASAARTTTGDTGAAFIATGAVVSLQVDVTAASGTAPSLTASVQWSNDGTTWFAADPVDSMTAITGVTRACKAFTTKGHYARAAWTVTGTTPSFTFSISAYSGG